MLDNIPVIGDLAEKGYAGYVAIVLLVPVVIVVLRLVLRAIFSETVMEKVRNLGPFKDDPVKDARKHEKKQEWKAAAKIYESADRVDDAVRCYRQIDDYEAAARLLERHERLDEAAVIYQELGSDQDLLKVWIKADNWNAIGEMQLGAGKPVMAAEAFAKAEDHGRAGECWAQAQNYAYAGREFEKAERFDLAGENYEKAYTQERGRAGGQNFLALKAAECFLRSKDNGAAGRMLEAAEKWEDAAKAFEAAGMPEKAGELFYRGRSYEEAARNLRAAGREERAHHVLAEMYEFDGKLAEAGESYRLSANPVKAGEMFEAAKMPAEAGACYEEAGDYVSASECYLRAGRDDKAAELLELQGRFGEAAPLWLKEGKMDKAIAAFDRGGRYYDAGLLLNQMGKVDEAITLFQKLEPESPGFREGQFVLGSLFRRKKHYELAADAFRKATGGKPPNLKNLELFYVLAETLWADGKPAEALKVYQSILSVKFDYKDVREKVAHLSK